MTQKLNFGKLVYLSVIVVSLGAFIVTTVDLFVEYWQEMTGFNIVEHVKTELELPAATICITDVFQNVDTDTVPNEILSNLTAHTFSADHIFHEDLKILKEKYIIQETFNYKNGHCFTLRTLKKAEPGIGWPLLYLKLKKANKYKVSVHESGAELWLQSNLKPSKITSFDVDGNKLEEEKVAYISLDLAMSKITNQNRKDYRCDPKQTLKTFTECSFNILSKIVQARNHSCSAMILKVNATLEESNICQDKHTFQEMKELETDTMETILVQQSYEACLKPCKKIEYVGSMTKVNQNARKLSSHQVDVNAASQYVGVWVKYDSFKVQEHQEYFILDKGGLVSSIGGFLGIFLGFSTLSIAEWIHLKMEH